MSSSIFSKKIYFMLFLMFTGPLIYAQWGKIPASLGGTLNDIEVADSMNIYVAGTDLTGNNNGLIFHSSDGGINWDTTLFVPGNSTFAANILKVNVLDVNTAYASAIAPRVYKTSNGGTSWDTTNIPGSSSFTHEGLYFVNAQIGLVGGFNGDIFKTTDGAQTWNNVHTNGGLITDIDCPGNSVCYARTFAVGGDNLLKTNDGGNSWVGVPSAPSTFLTGGMYCIDEDTIVTVSGTNIFRTTDGGQNWDTINNPSQFGLYDVSFFGNVGYAVGAKETILKSIDFGNSWTVDHIDTNSGEAINAIHIINQNVAFAVSSLGSVYKLGGFISAKEQIRQDDIKVFPNPSSGLFTIDIKTKPDGVIKVYDSHGRCIYTLMVDLPGAVLLDISAQPNGIYFMQYTDAENRVAKILVKE